VNAVQTPIALEVRLTCPECGSVGVTVLELRSELLISEGDEGEVRELRAKVKKKAVRHTCGQQTLDEAADGFRRTTQEMIDRGDVEQVTISHAGRTVDVATGEVLEEGGDE